MAEWIAASFFGAAFLFDKITELAYNKHRGDIYYEQSTG